MNAQLVSPLSFETPHTQATPMSVAVTRAGKLYDLRPALRDISLTIPVGARVAMLGPNGAGKTTLLRILATLAKPSTGRVEIEGLDVVTEANDVRRVVGYVGHQPHLYDELTARENLLFFARMYGLRDGAQRAGKLLERVGLRAKANQRVRTLSRGQTQRLALARGILHEPRLLLLDEPDTGLDDDANALLAELIRERADSLTTIFTTHNLERGLALSDTTLVLVGGRVAHMGPARDLTVDAVRAWYTRAGRRAL
ncbi:MAG TPA: heme ABC exporter ATP-binding protein CcmA [Ktedonobacterales bacterium]|nr:heme ABC exporter ATP-binding protein CcmA [Ktedonobacterales bacterium]